MQRFFVAFACFCAFAAWHASDLYPPWSKFQSEAWAGIALVCLSLSQRWKPETPLYAAGKFDVLSLCLLALPLLAGLHTITSSTVYLGDAALLTLYALGALLAMRMGQLFTAEQDGSKLLHGLCLLLVASALCSVGEALYQWLLLDGLGYWVLQIPATARPSGNFAQANRMAMHTATGIAALIWLYRQKSVQISGLTSGAVFLCIGIAITQSRAGLLSVVAIFLAAAGLQQREPRAVALYMALAMTAALLFWQLPALSDALELGSIRTNRLALGSRSTLLSGFALSTLQNPWWGYGPGQIVHAQIFLADHGLPAQVSFWAHHILLDFALLFGIPAMLAIAAALALYARGLLQNLQIESNQFVLLAIIPFAITLNTEFPHAYLNSLLLFAMIAGMARAGTAASSAKAELRAKRVLNALLSIFCALGGAIFFDYQRMETAFQVARFEALRAGAVPAGYQYPSALILDNLEALVSMVRRKNFSSMTSAELAEYRRSAMRFPYETALRGFAIAAALNAAPEEQDEALRIIDGLYGHFARNAAERSIKNYKNSGIY